MMKAKSDAALLATWAMCGVGTAADFQFFEPIWPPRCFRVIAHSGEAGEASENTLPTFEKALCLGANFVEYDVPATRGGQSYLLHDSTLGGMLNLYFEVKANAPETVAVAPEQHVTDWGIRPVQTDHALRPMRVIELQ